jgi:hypothetical protein
MSNISTLGNQIIINQNTASIATKFADQQSKIIMHSVTNSDTFEEENKRTKDTRETEETEGINENILDDEVYKINVKYKRQEQNRRNNQNFEDYIIDSKNGKINIKC